MIRLFHLDPDTDFLGGARNGAKVMIALRELALPHEVEYISRARDMRDPGSHFRREINPWGTVPVLEHDGFRLRESAAILRYLGDIAPANTFWPRAPRERALVDQWLTWECAMLVPSLLHMIRLGAYDGVDDPDPIERAQELHDSKLASVAGMRAAEAAWYRNLQILEDNLVASDYAAGSYSIADMAIGCAVPIGSIFGTTLKPYPKIVSWLERLERRPAWREERTFELDMQHGRMGGLIPCPEAQRAAIAPRRWAPR